MFMLAAHGTRINEEKRIDIAEWLLDQGVPVDRKDKVRSNTHMGSH